MLGGGPFELPRGAYSDDTAMALCLAESLLERDGFDARDQVQRYRRWQQEGYLSATEQCVGITAGTARALARAQWRRQPFSGSHDPEAQDPETLSRVTPVVLFFFADRRAGRAPGRGGGAHHLPVTAVVAACRALARALHAALSGAAEGCDPGRRGRRCGAPGSGGCRARRARRRWPRRSRSLSRQRIFARRCWRPPTWAAPATWWPRACGALAGAHYTSSAIPALWRNSLMKLPLIEESADRLLAHALVELAG